MKTDKEWEARARELLRRGDSFISHTTEQMALQLGREMAEEARLAKEAERAEDVEHAKRQAANARAEYIAQTLERKADGIMETCSPYSPIKANATRNAAKFARSTITKPKEPPAKETATKADLAAAFHHRVLHNTWDEPSEAESRMTATEAVMAQGEELRQRCVAKAEAAIRADERENAIADVLAAVEAKRDTCKEAGWPLGTWQDVVKVVKAMAKPKTREQVLEEALREARDDAIALGLDDTRRNIERALEWKRE